MSRSSTTPSHTGLKPVIIVIFGITGDLAQRKLLPALYHLLKDGLLHEDSIILGITRRDVSAAQLLGQVELCVNEVDNVCDPAGIAKVQQSLRMHQMSLTDGTEYDNLRTILHDIEDERGICMDRLYYLSIPPQMFEPIVRNLGEHGLNASCQHGLSASRLLVEKPFGYDTASAEALIEETGAWFSEDQLFRIDHYVAKDTVQDILAFRMFNPLITDIWNSRHIERIEVTAFEEITIEGRSIFYEGVGALRDFIQSHLLQLLTIITMELPSGQSSAAIHAAKQQLLQAIVPVAPDLVAQQAVRGQYDTYRAEVGNLRTLTETYAELTVTIGNDRWMDVPMTIRTGKAMDRKLTEIRIVFRSRAGLESSAAADAPGAAAATAPVGVAATAPSQLVFAIQPEEGISLQINAPRPAFADELQSIVLDFNQNHSFGAQQAGNSGPDAYERVLIDAVRGDHTLFTTSDEVLAAWRIVESVLHAWSASDAGLITYTKGSPAIDAA